MHYKLYSYNPDSDFNPDLEMVFPYTQSLLEMTVYQKKKKKSETIIYLVMNLYLSQATKFFIYICVI